MDAYDIVGHIGSVMSSITFIPQVYQVWKTKSARDLNMLMILIVFSSTIVWMIFGVGKGVWPVIICNGIICGLSVVLIYFKYVFGKDKNVRSA